jgi:hypothetical protein
MSQTPERMSVIVTACCVIHNILRSQAAHLDQSALDREDEDHRVHPGTWRQLQEMQPINQPLRGNTATNAAKSQRQYLINYVNSKEGAVPWQEEMAFLH